MAVYKDCFSKLVAQGLCDQNKAVKVLSIWRFASTIAQSDVTLGIADFIQDALNIPPPEPPPAMA